MVRVGDAVQDGGGGAGREGGGGGDGRAEVQQATGGYEAHAARGEPPLWREGRV